MTARIRDISSDVREIQGIGIAYELDDGRVAISRYLDAPNYYGRILLTSPPYQDFVEAAVDVGVAQIGRYFYRAKNGYLYFGTTRAGNSGKIVRSTDGGETWSVVHTTTSGDAIWHITEDSSGNLFANSYGDTAFEVYKSTDHGATWSVWLTMPNSIRHIHGIYCDSDDNLLIACGEWYTNQISGCTATWAGGVATITTPSTHKAIAGGVVTHTGFSLSGYNGLALPIVSIIDGTHYTVAIASDPGGAASGGVSSVQYYNGAIRQVTDGGASGTVGAAISFDGNGWTHMVEADNGRLVFGWDTEGGIISVMDRGDSALWSKQCVMNKDVADIGSYAFDGCIGRDGVIYMLMSHGSNEAAVYASPDDGVSWQILRIGGGVGQSILNITCNRSGPSGRVFLSGNSGNNIKHFPDYTRAQLRQRFPV